MEYEIFKEKGEWGGGEREGGREREGVSERERGREIFVLMLRYICIDVVVIAVLRVVIKKFFMKED